MNGAIDDAGQRVLGQAYIFRFDLFPPQPRQGRSLIYRIPIMTGAPLVSIVIPVYNGANYLREAIESALAQTYSNIEVIVVNDGSSDGGATEEIAQSYGIRIRYLRKENGGVASALNLGIETMKGEYFSWLSHDDVYLPEKIERQVNQMERLGEDVILYGDYNFIDETSKYLSKERIRAPRDSEFRHSLLYSHPVNGCTILVPRHLLLDTGTFDESLRATQDYDLWFRMAQRHRFVHMPGPLVNFRVHREQGTQALRPIFKKECSDFYSRRLWEVLRGWDRNESSKLIFLIRVAIFLERCGHSRALSHCKNELSGMSRKSFRTLDLKCWYWLTVYALFRVKRIFWR